MITIASLLTRKYLGLLKGNEKAYQRDIFAAFDGDEFVTTYPEGTALDVAIASATYENSKSSEDLRVLLMLEARDGNEDAAELMKRYPA